MIKKLVFVVVAIFLLIALGGLGVYSHRLSVKVDVLSQQLKSLNEQQLNLNAFSQQLQQLNEQVAYLSQNTVNVGGIYSRVEKSVVKIEVRRGTGEKVSGSGFFFDSQGHVVTNNHVIEDSKQIEVILSDGSIWKAKFVAGDVYSDLAVIRVPEAGIAIPLTLADSNNVKVGDQVVAVGSPFGLGGSVTSGIVSQKSRLLPVEGGYSIPDVIQFDAAINPGNSGGPLLNSRGEVVGVTTAIMTRPELRAFVGIGFAIPSNTVVRVIPSLVGKGYYRHPWLGITVTNLSPAIVEAMGLKVSRGLLVVEVLKGSPAQEAGLKGGNTQLAINEETVKVGGDVIIGMDKIDIKGLEDLLSYLSQKSPGEKATLRIIRDGGELSVSVTIGARPLPSK